MQTHAFPQPVGLQRSQRGLTPLRPIVAPSANPARPQAADTTSPLRDVMPTFIAIPFWFAQAAINLPVAITNNQALWYGLNRVAPSVMGQEFVLAGYDLSMRPTDSAPTAGDGIGWGSTDGFSARLVIGRNLPFQALRTWETQDFSGANMTGASGALQALGKVNPDFGPDYIARETFPTGKLSDATPNPKEIRQHFAEQYRVTFGQTLDVALVIRSNAAITGGAGAKTVYGMIEGILRVGLTKATQPWSR